MAKLSYAEIALKILKSQSQKNKKGLHYKEISKLAYEQDYVPSDNLIVAGNISSAMSSEIRKSKRQGNKAIFISFGKGYYGLIQNQPKGIYAEIRHKNNNVKSKLLQALIAMSASKFEELVAEVLRNLGFENIEVRGRTGDGGIDVIGELIVAGAIKNKVCVQVKKRQNNIQRSSISELRGSLRPHEIGLFVTTSDFSKPAIIEANDQYKAPISLINGKELVDIMCEYNIGIVSESVTIYNFKDIGLLNIIPKDILIKDDGIEIFATANKHEHFAIYFSENKVVYNDKLYKSVSAAGYEITGSQINGWKFWKFKDSKDGKIYPINRLRKK